MPHRDWDRALAWGVLAVAAAAACAPRPPRAGTDHGARGNALAVATVVEPAEASRDGGSHGASPPGASRAVDGGGKAPERVERSEAAPVLVARAPRPAEECIRQRRVVIPDGPSWFARRGPDCPCSVRDCRAVCRGPILPLPPETLESCAKACAAGNAGICARLGETYLHGIYVDEARPLGLEYLERACAAREANACVALAHERARDAPAPRSQVLPLLERACGRGVGCWELSEWLVKDGTPAELGRAHAFSAEICKKEWRKGCETRVPELFNHSLRCCEAARARVRPGDLMAAMKIASVCPRGAAWDPFDAVTTMVEKVFGDEFIEECTR